MEPLFLKSEDALFEYLNKFLKEKPGAVQLDGSSSAKTNHRVLVVFRYSVNGEKYKLLGETTRKAIESFVQLVVEHGEAGVVLRESTDSKIKGLLLENSIARNGWACLPYVNKSSEKLKKIA